MKNFKNFMFLFAFLVIANFTFAQNTGEAYYIGQWNVTFIGTPQGDITMPMKFDRKDGKLVGIMVNPETKVEEEMTSVTVFGDELTCAFTAGGYDLSMTITKKDDDNAEGKLLQMIDVTAKRVKM